MTNYKRSICPTCGKEFALRFRNGVKQSRYCPSCTLKRLHGTDKTTIMNRSGEAKKSGSKRKKATPWKEKGLSAMIQHVQSKFCNPYIRERDIAEHNGKCISCNATLNQAGHRFCVGDFPGMRFMVNNIHGQEVSCNMYKSGNIDAFDFGLIERHGQEYLDRLKDVAKLQRRHRTTFSRFEVIAIGETYKYLLKERIWIYDQDEFDQYKLEIMKKL